MRNLREAIVILATIALAGLAGFGLALAAADLSGGVDGWGGIIAILVAGIAVFLALVSSTIATLVVRRRGWRLAVVLLTLAGAGYLGLSAIQPGRSADEALAETALFVACALAVWLPVGARWWLESFAHGPESADPAAETPVSRRSAIVAGVGCAAVVAVATSIVLAVAGSSIPPGLTGFALVLVATAAAASGRVPETMALALLAGVGVAAVLFGLPSLDDGGLIIGALAVVVLITLAWRPAAARLTAARLAATTPVLPPSQ